MEGSGPYANSAIGRMQARKRKNSLYDPGQHSTFVRYHRRQARHGMRSKNMLARFRWGSGKSVVYAMLRWEKKMTEEKESNERQELKRALLRSVVRIASENSVLDKEDEEMIVRYQMREITKAEFEAFANAKALRIERQIKRPQ